MKRGFPARLVLIAAVVAIAGLSSTGCGDEVITVSEIVEQFFTNTRADAVMTVVSTYWFKPTGLAINPGNQAVNDLRLFCCSDGSAIYAFLEGSDAIPVTAGGSFLYAGYISASGTMYQPVQLNGDFYLGSIHSLHVVFNANGDASLLFIGRQDEDPENPDDDDDSRRVYYTTFRQAFAGTDDNGDGLTRGFDTWATPLDRNTPLDDEGDDLFTTFFATNLMDGPLSFTGLSSSVEETGCSGSRGLDLEWFLFFGWIGSDTGGTDVEQFIEGVFINLDSSDENYLTPGDTIVFDTSPAFDAADGDKIGSWVQTSGCDIAFVHDDADNGNGVAQQTLQLVRVDLTGATPDVTDPIAIARGQSLTEALINNWFMVGAGLEPFTGQTGTWFVIGESGYTDATVTQADADILVARVPADATDENDVEIDEFDAQAADAGEASDASLSDLAAARGLTHGVLYITQAGDDPAGAMVSDSLWAIGIVFSDGSADDFTRLISNPLLLTPDADDDEGDTDLLDYVLANDPGESLSLSELTCSPDSDPLNFGLLYTRDVDDEDEIGLYAADIAFDAVEQDPGSQVGISLDLSEVATMDNTWAGFDDLALVDGGNGGWVATFSGQGNNTDDSTDDGAFGERRQFVWASGLHGDQDIGTPERIGSGVLGDDLLFPDYRTLFSGSTYHATPGTGFAGRDSTFDLESAEPQLLHIQMVEYDDSPGNGAVTLRYRMMDLRDSGFAAAVDRFSPSLDEAPVEVAGPATDIDVDAIWSEGNNVTMFLDRHTPGNGTLHQVTTLDTSTWTFVCPANYTNDDPTVSIKVSSSWYFSGWTTTTCCKRILGGWVFWEREIGSESRLQARRVTGLTLPDEE